MIQTITIDKEYTDMTFANHVSYRHCNKYDAKNNIITILSIPINGVWCE